MGIDEIIEKFKNSDYIRHANEHRERRKLGSKLKKDIKNMNGQEFRDFINQEPFRMCAIWPNHKKKIVENFDANKSIWVNLILGTEPIEKRIEKSLTINGVGIYTMSMILSATNDDNEYILYHKNLILAIKELYDKFQMYETSICINEINTINSTKKYIKFNELCKVLRDKFGFNNLDELHEFLWHGHDTKWEFGKTKYS
jgi:hypothetical protein